MSRATERLYQDWTDFKPFEPKFVPSKNNPSLSVEQDAEMQRLDMELPRGDLAAVGVALTLITATLTTAVIALSIWWAIG